MSRPLTYLLRLLALTASCQSFFFTGSSGLSQGSGVPLPVTASGRFWNSSISLQSDNTVLSGTQASAIIDGTTGRFQPSQSSLGSTGSPFRQASDGTRSSLSPSTNPGGILATPSISEPSQWLSAGRGAPPDATVQIAPAVTALTSVVSGITFTEAALVASGSAEALVTLPPDISPTLALDQPEATSSVSNLSSQMAALFVPLQGWQKDQSNSDGVIIGVQKTETFATSLLAQLQRPSGSSGGCTGSLFGTISCAIKDLHNLVNSITAKVEDEVEDLTQDLHKLVDDIASLQKSTPSQTTISTTASRSSSSECSKATVYDVTVSCAPTMTASRMTTTCETSTKTSTGCSITGRMTTVSSSTSSCSASTVSLCTNSCTVLSAGSTSSCTNICATVSGCSVTASTTSSTAVATESLEAPEHYYKPGKDDALHQEVSAMLYSMFSSQGLLIDGNSTSTQALTAPPSLSPAAATPLTTAAPSTLMTMASSTATASNPISSSSNASMTPRESSTETFSTTFSAAPTGPPKCSRNTLAAPAASTTIIDCQCDNGMGGSLTTVPNDYVGCALAATQTVTIEDLKPSQSASKPVLQIAFYMSGDTPLAANEWLALYDTGSPMSNDTFCHTWSFTSSNVMAKWSSDEGKTYDVDKLDRYTDNATFPFPGSNQKVTQSPVADQTNCEYVYADGKPGYLTCDQGHQVCIVDEAPPWTCSEGEGVAMWPRVKCPLFQTSDSWGDLGGD